MRFVAALVVVLVCASCGSDNKPSTPTGPSQTPPPQTTTTRIIGVSGNLAFGSVDVGQSRTATMTISNSGNTALTVTSLTVSGGLVEHTRASWTDGTIAAGGSQAVTIEFAPNAPGSYSGVITVVGNHTSGSNTVPISGTAVDNSFTGNWSGSYVIDRCDGTGSVQDLVCGPTRGVFRLGQTLPVTANLTQNGSSVSGTVAFGQVRGIVNGNVTNGVLTLQGTGTGGQLTAQISSWSTRVNGRSMTGNVTYNVTFSGVPGTAVIVTRAALTK